MLAAVNPFGSKVVKYFSSVLVPVGPHYSASQ